MNTKLLHRLAWKELRTLRALWLSLLAMALVMLFGVTWFAESSPMRSEWVYSIALFLPVVYSLACAALAFAGECEDGTDQLLSRLAAPPLALLSTKVAMNLLSTAALLVILYPLAWKLAPWTRYLMSDGRLQSIQLLALAWGLSLVSWGLFFSLLFRRVMTCLVTATVAATITPLVVGVALDSLPISPGKAEMLDWSLKLLVIPGLLLLASTLLVQTWDENRWPRIVELLLDGWRRLTATRERSVGAARLVERRRGDWRVLVRPFGVCLPDEWLPAWRREARRLLWLEWRQARRVTLFVGLAFGVYVASQAMFVTDGMNLLRKESPFVLALIAFLFGVSSFQAQQSEKRYRGFAGHGVSAAAMWLIKQGVWFATMLFVAIVVACLSRTPNGWLSLDLHSMHEPFAKLGYGIHWSMKDSSYFDLQWYREGPGSLVMNVTLSLGLCFAVGQFASLLIPRAVTAAAVGFVLAGMAFGWQQLTAHLAIPSALAVLPLIVGLLCATFVRMTDWLEERNSIRSWCRVATACLVPSLVTLIGVPIYRVVEIPLVEPYWQVALHEATTPPSEAARKTAVDWIRAAELIDGDPVLRWKQLGRQAGNQEETEVEVVRQSAGLFDLESGFATWKNLQNHEWVSHNASVLTEAARLAQQPDCAFSPAIFEGGWASQSHGPIGIRSLSRLAFLLSMAAQSAMAEGRLEDGLQRALTLHRLGRHLQRHAGWHATSIGHRVEKSAWQLLLDWARHPNQTGESLRDALGRPGFAPQRPLHGVLFPDPKQRILASNLVMSEYAVAKMDLDRRWREAIWPATWLICERLREERLLDYSTMSAVDQFHQAISDSATSGHGEARYIQDFLGWRPGRADFLRGTTRSFSFNFHHPYFLEQRANELGQTELRRRAMIATLALRAFHFDHGHWPIRWEELVGDYLGDVPVDPWSGQPFQYRPDGFPFDLTVAGRTIPANTPLFLSGGPRQQTLTRRMRPPSEKKSAAKLEWQLGIRYGVGGLTWPVEENFRVELVCFPLSESKP